MVPVLTLAAALWIGPVPPPGITWQTTFAVALEKAKNEQRPVFLAVVLDGEHGSERLVRELYRDKDVVALTELCSNVIASAGRHGRSEKSCGRFAGIACDDHVNLHAFALEKHLKSNDEGEIAYPQHVFFDAEGRVLFSVPFDIEREELLWCLATAIARVNPNLAGAMHAEARVPRRLILDGVHDPARDDTPLRPLTKSEVQELVAELRRGRFEPGAFEKIRRLVRSSEPEAIEHCKQSINSPFMNFGENRLRKMFIRSIGDLSPPEYWEVVFPLATHPDVGVRNESLVALEQLGAREAAAELRSIQKKIEEPLPAKNLLRALGTCGADDGASQKLLLRATRSEKDLTLRNNAILAVGSLEPTTAVEKALAKLLEDDATTVRIAAACAMGLSRMARFASLLERRLSEEKNPEVKAMLEGSIAVLHGRAPLASLEATVTKIGKDEIPRARMFGRGTVRGQ